MIRPPPRSTLFPSTPLSQFYNPTPPKPARHTEKQNVACSQRRVLPMQERNARCSRATLISNNQLATTDYPHASAKHRSEEHTSELQSQSNLVCRLLLEKKKY